MYKGAPGAARALNVSNRYRNTGKEIMIEKKECREKCRRLQIKIHKVARKARRIKFHIR